MAARRAQGRPFSPIQHPGAPAAQPQCARGEGFDQHGRPLVRRDPDLKLDLGTGDFERHVRVWTERRAQWGREYAQLLQATEEASDQQRARKHELHQRFRAMLLDNHPQASGLSEGPATGCWLLRPFAAP